MGQVREQRRWEWQEELIEQREEKRNTWLEDREERGSRAAGGGSGRGREQQGQKCDINRSMWRTERGLGSNE